MPRSASQIVDDFFFFFSSRRRHTRSLCDWSSDVCSSDLPNRGPLPGIYLVILSRRWWRLLVSWLGVGAIGWRGRWRYSGRLDGDRTLHLVGQQGAWVVYTLTESKIVIGIEGTWNIRCEPVAIDESAIRAS